MPQTSLAAGRYRLVEPIGSGGMATVWRAWDERLQVDRAAKVLMGTDKRVAERFAEEARVMARVRHAHVVQVLDAGADPEGPWLVMELVQGGSLQERLQDCGALPVDEVVRLGVQICGGLQAAHDAGVVHRDVKPDNVLITSSGDAKVTDFGIARVDWAGRHLTVSGMAIGTLDYMAPEQRHDARSVDARADVYGVGATLYALATGSRPLELYNPVVARGVYGEVPDVLRPVIERATRFDPSERYANVAALAQALEAAVGPPWGRRAALLSGAGKGAALALSAVVLLGGLGLGAGLAARGLTPEAPDPAPLAVVAPPVAPVVAPIAPEAPAVPEPSPTIDPEAWPPPAAVVAVAPTRPGPAPASPDPEPSRSDVPAAMGAFFVNSRPQAVVRIGDQTWGSTPVEGQLAEGTHAVQLVHPELGATDLELRVEEAERAVLCWNFETEAPCSRR